MRAYLEFFARVNLEQNERLLRMLDLLGESVLTESWPFLYGGSILGALRLMAENARFTQSDMCPVPSARFREYSAPYITETGKENRELPLETYDQVRQALLTLSRGYVDGFRAAEEKEIVGDKFPTYDFLSKGLFMAMNIRGQIVCLLSQMGVSDLEKQFEGPLIPRPELDLPR